MIMGLNEAQMPYRPAQHQIAGKAVAKVSEVWASIGAAVEEVRQDYGEDLLVQTQLNDRMDAARLWVQVKGVRHAPSMNRPDGRTQVRVRADLALRWARSADILVLVLWDVENDLGWYSIPRLTDLHSELANKGRQMFSLHINSSDLFNSDSARAIAWEARLEHLAGFIRNFRRMQEEQRDEDDPDKGSWANEAIAEAVIDMMADLNMVDLKHKNGQRSLTINAEFKDFIRGNGGEVDEESTEDMDEYVLQLVLISLLKKISYEAGTGASISVLTEMSSIVYTLLDLRKFLASNK
jgi:hypothetical protein